MFYIEAITTYAGHDTKQGVIDNGKPLDQIEAKLHRNNIEIGSDVVQYMVVTEGSFYPTLQATSQLRSAMGAEGVYPQSDLPNYALELIGAEEAVDVLDLPSEVLDLLTPDTTTVGFKAALYRDYVSGGFLLAYGGTEYDPLTADWTENIAQVSMQPAPQHQDAMRLARLAWANSIISTAGLILTGHSLGGGLASSGSVVTGVKAHTFNASGLRRETLLARDAAGELLSPRQEIYAGSLNRFDNLASTLVDAYYLDWDLLSFLQDNVGWQIPYIEAVAPNVLATLNPAFETMLVPAIGNRIEMDGPLDLEIALLPALPATWLVSPVPVMGPVLAAFSLMGLAHMTEYYHYGLMVDADELHNVNWDIYGVDLIIGDHR